MLPEFFIVGCQRSGTTLLRKVLCAHPQIAIPPETSFYYWPRTEQADTPLSQHDLDNLEPALRLTWHSCARPGHNMRQKLDTLHPNWRQVRDSVAGSDRLPCRVLECLIKDWLERNSVASVAYVGEKSPQHLFRVDRILKNQPNARFVNVVRDPRSVAASLRRMPWFRGGLTHAVYHWSESVKRGLHLEERLGSDRIHTVYFESFVHNPEECLRTLCQFLHIEFDQRMTRHSDQKSAVGHAPVDYQPWHQMSMRPIDPAAATKWRDEMSDNDVALVDRRSEHLCHRLGYLPATSKSRRYSIRMAMQIVMESARHPRVADRGKRGIKWLLQYKK